MERLPESTYPAIHPFDVEMGAVCEDCGRPFRLGDRYASRLLGIAGDIPVTETVCLSCEGYREGCDSPV
jgi:hypothetical protein